MEEILKDSNEIVPEKRKEKKKSGGRGWLVFKIIMFVIFLLYAISLIYPVFYGFLTSLKSQSEFMEDPNRLPQEWLFSNYIVVFNELSADGSNMFNMFFNSIWYTLGGTILGVEAAFIDGAGDFRVFIQVMVPQTLSIVLALCVVTSINFWNDYMGPLLFLRSYPTLATGIYRYRAITAIMNQNTPVYFSALIISMIPVLAVFVAFQNKMMDLSLGGGIKG